MNFSKYFLILATMIASIVFISCSESIMINDPKVEYTGQSKNFIPIGQHQELKVLFSDTTLWYDEAGKLINTERRINNQKYLISKSEIQENEKLKLPLYISDSLIANFQFRGDSIFISEGNYSREYCLLPSNFSIGTTWLANIYERVQLKVSDYFQYYVDPFDREFWDVIKISFSLDDEIFSGFMAGNNNHTSLNKIKLDGYFLIAKDKGLLSIKLNNYDTEFTSSNDFVHHFKKSGVYYFIDPSFFYGKQVEPKIKIN